MNWSDLQSIWKQQEPVRPTDADLGELAENLEAKRRKLARRFLVRDTVEATTGVLVALIFSHNLWRYGLSYWPDAIAILIILGVTGFFISERIRAHRMRVSPAAPLLTKLEADIAELEHQRGLLLQAGWWYVAPVMLAILIMLSTMVSHNLQHLHALKAQAFLAGYLGFCGLLAWGITRMNRRAARTKIEPWLVELRKRRDDILSSC